MDQRSKPGTEFTFGPDSDWVTFVTPGMRGVIGWKCCLVAEYEQDVAQYRERAGN